MIFGKFVFLNSFQKAFDSIHKTKFNPIHLNFPKVQKAWQQLNTSKESFRKFRIGPEVLGTTQNKGAELGNSPPARHKLACQAAPEHGSLFWVSTWEPTNFHHKYPSLILFDPNSSPKVVHYLLYIKRHLKQQQTWNHNINSHRNHHYVHFTPIPTFFSFFMQTSQTTIPIQTPINIHSCINIYEVNSNMFQQWSLTYSRFTLN